MDVNIQAINFDASEKLVAFVNKKIDRLVRHFPEINTVEVKMRVIKPETAMNKEVVMNVLSPGSEFVGNKVADTFEEAIYLAIEAVNKMAEKAKEKKMPEK